MKNSAVRSAGIKGLFRPLDVASLLQKKTTGSSEQRPKESVPTLSGFSLSLKDTSKV